MDRFQEAYALHQAGKQQSALSIYQSILAEHPDHFNARQLAATIFLETGRYSEAMEHFSTAHSLRPDNETVLMNWGVCYLRQGDAVTAFQKFSAGLEQSPDDTFLLQNYINAALKIERLTEGEKALAKLKKLLPDAHATRNLCGMYALAQRDHQAACRHFVEAIAASPDTALYHANLAVVYEELNQVTAARFHCEKASALGYSGASLYLTRACIAYITCDYKESINWLDQALERTPKDSDLLYYRGLAYLAAGDFEKGWRDYEARFLCHYWIDRDYAAAIRASGKTPEWKGEDLTGKHLLIVSEAGYGDSLMMMRYVPLLARQAARISLVLGPHTEALSPLLQSIPGIRHIFASAKAAEAAAGKADFHICVGSLPHRLQSQVESIPAPVPPDFSNPLLVERGQKWADWLALNQPPSLQNSLPGSGFSIGVNFGGNPNHKNDHRRSVPFALGWRLLREIVANSEKLKGARLISLQHHLSEEQKQQLQSGEEAGSHIMDFADSTALMAQLDLLISVDSALAHLAGICGKPAYVLLPYGPDWRWAFKKETSPWYPGLRLFRQKAPGDWQSVFAQLRQSIEQMVLSHKV